MELGTAEPHRCIPTRLARLRPFDPEPHRDTKACEALLPVGPGCRSILGVQPLDVPAEFRSRRRSSLPSGASRFDKLKNLLKQGRERSAIKQDVMERPHHNDL